MTSPQGLLRKFLFKFEGLTSVFGIVPALHIRKRRGKFFPNDIAIRRIKYGKSFEIHDLAGSDPVEGPGLRTERLPVVVPGEHIIAWHVHGV